MSLAELKNILRSLLLFVKNWYRVGFGLASPMEQNKRREICFSCPLVKPAKRIYCGVCKCPIGRKVLPAASSCPNGYWGAVEKKISIAIFYSLRGIYMGMFPQKNRNKRL
jgi:hypothetical protein